MLMTVSTRLRSVVLLIAILQNAFVSCQSTDTWDMTTSTIKYQGKDIVVHGFAVTCLEYLLRGVGMECMAEYQWSNPSNIITKVNTKQADALMQVLDADNAHPGVMPSVRFSLNAGYYLDVETSDWSDNRAKYPNLAAQYRTLIDELVKYFTSRNVLVILDLHWNDDKTEQQGMALKSTGTSATGDSLTFWNDLANSYKDNQLVWYELYNEPYVGDYDIWMNGDSKYEGMLHMYNAVRAHTDNPIIIAGASNYAYDVQSLVSFDAAVAPKNVLYNLHPYMGPLQRNDQSKSISGFSGYVQTLKGLNKPIIMTEFGQYCCKADGECYLYNGEYNGQSMGYVEALLTIAKKEEISWTAWAYRPQSASGGADCNQPDANDGLSLYNASSYNGNGAPWAVLYPKYYGAKATDVGTTTVFATTTTTTVKSQGTTSALMLSSSTPRQTDHATDDTDAATDMTTSTTSSFRINIDGAGASSSGKRMSARPLHALISVFMAFACIL